MVSMRTMRGVAVGIAMGAALACGDAPPAEPTGAWMNGAPAAAQDGSGLAETPRVENLALRPSTPRPGEPIRAFAHVSGPQSLETRLVYRWTVNGREVPVEGPELPAEFFGKGDSVELTVTPESPAGVGAPVHAQARAGNAAPRILAVSLAPPLDARPGTPLYVAVEAEDPDGDRLRTHVRWLVNGSEVARDTETLDTTGLHPGDRVAARVRVDDGGESSDEVTTTELVLGNAPPVIRSQPKGLDAEGEFTYRIEAQDPEGETPLRYRLLAGPPGMSLDPVTGTLTWRPSASDAGEHPVAIAVEDRRGGRAEQRFALTVTAPSSPPASPAE